MLVEVLLSITVFGIFALILWRLKKISTPKRKRYAYTAHHLNNQKQNVSFNYTPLSRELTDNSAKEFNVDDIVLPEEFIALKLLTSEINNTEQQQTIEQICQSFRKPHPLLLPLTQKAFEPNELFELIRTDPQITAKVINRVNSSAFALTQPITSINHAINYLGIGTVKNIAMHFAMENDDKFETQQQQQAYQKLWHASYLASSLGLLFAKELLMEDASDISTRCLLNYLGDMAILSTYPDMSKVYQEQKSLYQRVIYCQTQLSINTQIIGSSLARYWQLPRSLVRSIENNLSLLIVKNDLSEIDKNEMLKYQICYTACRIADLAIINEQPCIETMRDDLTQQLDFYSLFKNDLHPKIKKLFNLFHDVSFSKKMNGLLLVK
ncbi:HDOD domain-containing protein [Thalassotalea profundi]|uniref:HDOD domain-containing protein n=1 Tax=Thalassotalea profundi TaxID=2036687 RepID=A0ABQ3IFA7_9GAMM|nr:HDOD domain-containing protein [Thalassotalea profundi]GHE81483.1 hypothetical protein GCM10011501_07090 [Thalassotalea profundi]